MLINLYGVWYEINLFFLHDFYSVIYYIIAKRAVFLILNNECQFPTVVKSKF